MPNIAFFFVLPWQHYGSFLSRWPGSTILCNVVSTCFCFGQWASLILKHLFFISSFTTSSQYFFGLPLFMLPGTLSNLAFLIWVCSIHSFRWPSHLTLASPIWFFISCTPVLSPQAIRNPITTRLSTQHPDHFHFCYMPNIALFFGEKKLIKIAKHRRTSIVSVQCYKNKTCTGPACVIAFRILI